MLALAPGRMQRRTNARAPTAVRTASGESSIENSKIRCRVPVTPGHACHGMNPKGSSSALTRSYVRLGAGTGMYGKPTQYLAAKRSRSG